MDTDEQRSISSMMNDICKDIVAPYVRPKERIFIDIETLYDFKLGALIALRAEDSYDYIMSRIDEYLKAYDLEIAKHFPDLNISEEMINAFIADPYNQETLSLLAPPRAILEDLEDVIRGINTFNTSKERTEPLKITINQSTFRISDRAKDRLTDYILSIDPLIDIEYTEYTWQDIPKDVLTSFDVMIIYDIASFVSMESKQVIEAIQDGMLGHMSIATFMQVTNHNCDRDEGIANFAATMEVFCNSFLVLDKELIVQSKE